MARTTASGAASYLRMLYTILQSPTSEISSQAAIDGPPIMAKTIIQRLLSNLTRLLLVNPDVTSLCVYT